MCEEKWILCNIQWRPAQCLDWEAPKHFPKPNLHQKAYFCLVVCYPSDPLQFSESQWYNYIWDVCSADRWDAPKNARPAVGICQQKGPNSSPQNAQPYVGQSMLQKSNKWAVKFCLICQLTSRQLTTTSSSISTTFFRENASITSRTQKMLSKSLSNPKACFIML